MTEKGSDSASGSSRTKFSSDDFGETRASAQCHTHRRDKSLGVRFVAEMRRSSARGRRIETHRG